MGSARFWLILIGAQILILVILAALGPLSAETPALRYTGWACAAGIFICMPPLVIKLFLAGQVKIGNGALPSVRMVEQNQIAITIGVWVMIGAALAMALPTIRADIAAEIAANTAADNVARGDAMIKATDSVARAAAAAANSTQNGTATAGSSSAPTNDNPVAASNDTTPVLTPGAGSKTRTAILDALRDKLKLKGRFRVDHIRTYKTWAFVRATEVVELDKGELQETDLTVSALLELPANSALPFWRIVELWTLPDNETHSMADFVRGVRAKQRAERLPAALFPDDLQ